MTNAEGVVKQDPSLEDWHGRTKLTIKGHLQVRLGIIRPSATARMRYFTAPSSTHSDCRIGEQMFRGVENVWTLVLNTGSMGKGGMQKVTVKVEPGEVEYSVDALKIVAMKKDA